MTPLLHRHIPHPCQPALEITGRRFSNRPNRKWFLIPLAGLVVALALASCGGDSPPTPPPVPVTDTQPVGEGLKVIGFALLGAAVVGVLGRMLK
jgi:hypothetical protein